MYTQKSENVSSRISVEQTENLRKVLLKHKGTVTVGDIVSETGVGKDEAQYALNQFILFIFNLSIFIIPLLRMPANRKENRRRRMASVKYSALGVFESWKNNIANVKHIITQTEIIKSINLYLDRFSLHKAKNNELLKAIKTVCADFRGEYVVSDNGEVVLNFERMANRLKTTQMVRDKLKLDKKDRL